MDTGVKRWSLLIIALALTAFAIGKGIAAQPLVDFDYSAVYVQGSYDQGTSTIVSGGYTLNRPITVKDQSHGSMNMPGNLAVGSWQFTRDDGTNSIIGFTPNVLVVTQGPAEQGPPFGGSDRFITFAAGTFTKSGDGQLTLSSPNVGTPNLNNLQTYVRNGTLAVKGIGTIGLSTLTISPVGTFILDRDFSTDQRPVVFENNATNNSRFIFTENSGINNWELSGSGDIVIGGSITLGGASETFTGYTNPSVDITLTANHWAALGGQGSLYNFQIPSGDVVGKVIYTAPGVVKTRFIPVFPSSAEVQLSGGNYTLSADNSRFGGTFSVTTPNAIVTGMLPEALGQNFLFSSTGQTASLDVSFAGSATTSTLFTGDSSSRVVYSNASPAVAGVTPPLYVTGNSSYFAGSTLIQEGIVILSGATARLNAPSLAGTAIEIADGATLGVANDSVLSADSILLKGDLRIDLTGNSGGATLPMVQAQSITFEPGSRIFIDFPPSASPTTAVFSAASITNPNDVVLVLPTGYTGNFDGSGNLVITPPSNGGGGGGGGGGSVTPAPLTPATQTFDGKVGGNMRFAMSSALTSSANKSSFRLTLTSQDGKRVETLIRERDYLLLNRDITLLAAFLSKLDNGEYRLEAWDGSSRLAFASIFVKNANALREISPESISFDLLEPRDLQFTFYNRTAKASSTDIFALKLDDRLLVTSDDYILGDRSVTLFVSALKQLKKGDHRLSTYSGTLFLSEAIIHVTEGQDDGSGGGNGDSGWGSSSSGCNAGAAPLLSLLLLLPWAFRGKKQ